MQILSSPAKEVKISTERPRHSLPRGSHLQDVQLDTDGVTEADTWADTVHWLNSFSLLWSKRQLGKMSFTEEILFAPALLPVSLTQV